MAKNVFTNKLEAIKKDVFGTIQSNVEKLLADKKETHYIELDEGVNIDKSDMCDTFICEVELTDENEVVLTDNDQNTYSLDDNYLSLEVFAEIADVLTDKGFDVLQKDW